MFKQSLFAFSLLAFSTFINADAVTAEALELTIQGCESCHSDQHNQSAELSSIAPVLNGMSDWYIEQQQANFQSGKRAIDGPDQQKIKQAHSAEAIKGEALSLVADHYDELEIRFSQLALTAVHTQTDHTPDLNNGEALFEDQCASCHTSMIGRFLSDGPEITHLEAPYLLKELQDMKSGQRQFQEETKHHRKMVQRLKEMSTQDLIDIVSYINKNAQSL